MRIVHHASGSKANGFEIKTTDNIVIDCGVKDIACDVLCVTHTHGDHFQYFGEYLLKCKKLVASSGVVSDMIKKHPVLKPMILEKLCVDDFSETYVTEHYTIEVFDLYHDVPCCGFIIQEYNGQKYVHITDTGHVDITQNMKNADYVSIESNYDPYLLQQSKRGRRLKSRIERTHLSNEQAATIAHQITRKNGCVAFIHISNGTNYPTIAKMEHEAILNGITAIYPEGICEYGNAKNVARTK